MAKFDNAYVVGIHNHTNCDEGESCNGVHFDEDVELAKSSWHDAKVYDGVHFGEGVDLTASSWEGAHVKQAEGEHSVVNPTESFFEAIALRSPPSTSPPPSASPPPFASPPPPTCMAEYQNCHPTEEGGEERPCCDENEDGVELQCYAKDDEKSKCRTSCPSGKGWLCEFEAICVDSGKVCKEEDGEELPCCDEDSTCFAKNEKKSKCKPSCPSNWDCQDN
jgi:hypothetical protein